MAGSSSVTAEVNSLGSLEDQISSMVQEMNALNGAIAQERQTNRMLQVDYDYAVEQKSK